MSSSRCSTGQFGQLQRPYNQVMGVAAAHLQRVVAELRRRDDIVLVHDHQEAFGPTVLGALGSDRPPVLHTLHWDLRKHPELYGSVGGGGRVGQRGVVRPADHGAARAAGAERRARSPRHPAGRARRPPAGRRQRPSTSSSSVGSRRTRVSTSPPGSRTASGATSCWRDPSGPSRSRRAGQGGRDKPDVRYWREPVQPLVDGGRVSGWARCTAPERDELVATADAALFPHRLGGAWRDRRHRVPRPRHAGGRVSAAAACRSWWSRPHRSAGAAWRRGCVGPRGQEATHRSAGMPAGGGPPLHPGPDGRAVPAALRRGAAAQRSRGLGEPDAAGRAAPGARVAGPGDRRRPRQRGR